MKSILTVLSLFSVFAFGHGVKDEVEFGIKSQHLDFSAPKSCKMVLEASGRTFSASYSLKDRSCQLDESGLSKEDSSLSKKADIFVCSMLVPALNTSGRDFFGSCSRKTVEGSVLTFSKCGPNKNMVTELNTDKLTVRTHIDGINNEFIQNDYKFVRDKIFPVAVELRSAIYHQKISKIVYDGVVPSSVQAEENGNNFKISFSKCTKNH